MRDEEIKKAVEILGTAIRKKRATENLSCRQLEELIGVSASTLSRIENFRGKPDAETVAKLCGWLNLPSDRVWNAAEDAPVVYYPDESLPEIVTAHLEKDKNLTPEDAARLAEIFRSAYRQFAGFEKK